MIVQVDERTDLLGYRLLRGAVPYKPNLRVSKPTTLPVSTTLRRNSVFSQQCSVSNTPPIPNSLWTIANKQSVVIQSTNSRVSSQALFLGRLAFPPGPRQSARARFRYRASDLFQFCRLLPSACISQSFRPLSFLFLVNSMVKKKSVPRRWGASSATAPAAALAVPVPVAPQTPRLPSNPPPSLPSYVNTAYEHGRPAGLTAPTWVPLHGAWILQTPTASPAQWFGSRLQACPAAPCGAPPGSPLLGSTGSGPGTLRAPVFLCPRSG